MKYLKFLERILLLFVFLGVMGACSKDDDDDKTSSGTSQNTQNNQNEGGNSQSSDNSQNGQSNGNQSIDEWVFLLEIENPRLKPVYLFVDGKSVEIIPSGIRFNASKNIVNRSEVLVEVKTAEGIVLDSQKVKKGGSYVKVLSKEIVSIVAYNSTSDNYDFYVDGKKIGIVYPGKYLSIDVEIGQHELYAKQLNGYILWATEEEKTLNITNADNDYYEWDFSKGTIKKGNSVG